MERGHINGPMDLVRLSWMLMRKGTARILRGLRDILFGLIDLGYGLLIPWLFHGMFVVPLALSFAKSSPDHGDAIVATVFVISLVPFPIVLITAIVGPALWMAAKITKWWRSRSREIDAKRGSAS